MGEPLTERRGHEITLQGKQIPPTGTGPVYFASGGARLTANHLAAVARDVAKTQLLSEVPLDVLRSSESEEPGVPASAPLAELLTVSPRRTAMTHLMERQLEPRHPTTTQSSVNGWRSATGPRGQRPPDKISDVLTGRGARTT